MSHRVHARESQADDLMHLCAACIATCNRIAGAHATDWIVRADHEEVDGIMRWSMYESIAAGSETTSLLVARLSVDTLCAERASGHCTLVTCPLARS